MSVLRLLAECGRVSRRTFDLLPYSYRNTSVYIKKLVDDRNISLSGQKGAWSYTLLDGGRQTLSAFNPQRYTPDLYELNKLLIRHPDRSRLRGDVAAVMSLAGFGVHPDDKPGLPAFTPPPPDFRTPSLRDMYLSKRPIEYGQIIPNQAMYTEHLTPVNCYYDAVIVKDLRTASIEKNVNYSRACGVLFTPSCLFRAYHSRDVAMRFHRTGEENFTALLRSAFTGYIPADNSGVIVFGQDWTSANSTLDNYLRGKTGSPSKRGEATGDMLGTTNLGNPLFYLPLRSEALELLALMRFPDWRRSLMYWISIAHTEQEQNNWNYQYGGRRVFIVADLNLTNLAIVLRGMMNNPRAPVTLICLPWQQDFIMGLAKEYGGDKANAEVVLLHECFMANLISKRLEPHWRGEAL
jgi:hypothetical protein